MTQDESVAGQLVEALATDGELVDEGRFSFDEDGAARLANYFDEQGITNAQRLVDALVPGR